MSFLRAPITIKLFGITCCAVDASGLKINQISKIDIPQQPYVFDAEIKINTIYQY